MTVRSGSNYEYRTARQVGQLLDTKGKNLGKPLVPAATGCALACRCSVGYNSRCARPSSRRRHRHRRRSPTRTSTLTRRSPERQRPSSPSYSRRPGRRRAAERFGVPEVCGDYRELLTARRTSTPSASARRRSSTPRSPRPACALASTSSARSRSPPRWPQLDAIAAARSESPARVLRRLPVALRPRRPADAAADRRRPPGAADAGARGDAVVPRPPLLRRRGLARQVAGGVRRRHRRARRSTPSTACVWFLGEPVSVFAEAGTFRAQDRDDDVAVAVIRFAGGAIGQITSTVNAMGPERTRLELYGTEMSALGGGEAYDTTKDLFTLATPAGVERGVGRRVRGAGAAGAEHAAPAGRRRLPRRDRAQGARRWPASRPAGRRCR